MRDGCRANKDVPPFIVAAHNPITYYGINAILMTKTGGFKDDIVDDIAKAYRQIYQCGTSLENALMRIKELIPESPEIKYLIQNCQILYIWVHKQKIIVDQKVLNI